MSKLVSEVQLGTRDLRRFEPILGAEAVATVFDAARRFRERLAGRVVWNVNSTAVGGGVAEMLQPLLGYTRGAGVDTRWLVIGGTAPFFELTKRLHHALHGSSGDGRALDEAARALYEQTTRDNAEELRALVQPGDFVLLHDPQTAGLAPLLQAHGAHVVWRCHIGLDHHTPEVEGGWAFLRPYIEQVPALVFSRAAYAPAWADRSRLTVVQPSIDAFSAKNQDLTSVQVRSILHQAQLVDGEMPANADRSFVRADGSPSRVERAADVVRTGDPPHWSDPLVTQISRWDPLKDMAGVMAGFASAAAAGKLPERAQLVLAGPNVRSVADDPEAPAVFDDVVKRREQLPEAIRRRIHLANLPTDDVEENAAIVNALQRHSTVVAQKSLQEGFGLTVTEAMWKARPVIASDVGGIRDQVVDGECGRLLKDAHDVETFGALLGELLSNPDRADAMGRAARERVREHFLGIRHLLQYAALLTGLDESTA